MPPPPPPLPSPQSTTLSDSAVVAGLPRAVVVDAAGADDGAQDASASGVRRLLRGEAAADPASQSVGEGERGGGDGACGEGVPGHGSAGGAP